MCSKVSWSTRRAARAAKRRLPPDGHLSVYWCAQHHGFHVGHLAPSVVHGLASRAQVYR